MTHKVIDYINSHYDIHEVYELCLGRKAPTGKFTCPNPEHVHRSNTPSAKIYGNLIKCFGSCNRCFGCYDLLKWYRPDMIDQIKTSVIVTDGSEQRKSAPIEKVDIDRTKSMAEVLYQITGINVN